MSVIQLETTPPRNRPDTKDRKTVSASGEARQPGIAARKVGYVTTPTPPENITNPAVFRFGAVPRLLPKVMRASASLRKPKM